MKTGGTEMCIRDSYKDARHDIFNELDRLQAFGDISRWLEAQLSAQAEARDEQAVN